MSLTKSEFVKILQEKLASNEIELSRVNAEACARLVFANIQAVVREHGEFRWPGFGTFRKATRVARTAHNPRTGDAIEVPEKDVVTFKAYSGFLDKPD